MERSWLVKTATRLSKTRRRREGLNGNVMELGYALMCEEHGPQALLDDAARAEEAGFELFSVSDHYHPWLSSQGHSPFAWSVLGALTARTALPLISMVTCPIKRYHPAIVAQMAATTACLARGGFTLGLGTGEHLNEHVVGGEWPDPAVRQEQLQEAVEIMRQLFSGDEITHYGEWFTVDRARLFTLPEEPPAIAVAAGGSSAAQLAAELGAGLVTVGPNTDLVEVYRDAGGIGPVIGQASACWHTDAGEAKKIMRERWRQGTLGWDVNAELPTPAAFEAATQTVREDDVVGSKPIGNDVDDYLKSLGQFQDAGYDRVLMHNIGREQAGFLAWAERQLLPAWRS